MAKALKTPDTASSPEGDAQVAEVVDSGVSETHVYPDGSAVNGRPPWPELSPMQRAARAAAELAKGKAAA